MTDDFEQRLRAEMRLQANNVRMPDDPVGDVRGRMRRQDVVVRSVGTGLAAVVVLAVVVVAGLPGLQGDQITFDYGPADAPDGVPEEQPEGVEPSDDDAPACSAAGMPTPIVREGLPTAAAETRARIIEAALACDMEGLAAVAAESTQFTFSYGGGEDPAAFWRQAEADGEEVLRALVEVLDVPHGTVVGVDPALYVWPSAYLYESWEKVPVEERDALRDLYDDADFEEFAQFGSYIGYRVGISADGEWRYFVAGD